MTPTERTWMHGFATGVVIACLTMLAMAMLARGQTPQSEVIAAHADAVRLPEDVAKQTRYLTLLAIPVKDRPNAIKAISVHVNGMSREADLVALRLVSPTLLALCCDDYGWELVTYGALHESEPYFHVKLRTGKEVITAAAPWLPKEIAELSKVTGSLSPILRGDWFLHATADPQTYYSFLGIKKLSDLEKLVGLDRATSVRVRKEMAAIISESTVAINPRAIIRLQGASGAWFETHDNRDPSGDGNPLRKLNGDHKFAFREIYATLPNGLFAMALSTDKDDLQSEAPPDVASDGTSSTPDRRIRPPSCIRCHAGTLQPLNDYSRRVFGSGRDIALAVPADRVKAKRLSQLYLGPLLETLEDDKAYYARTLSRFVGMKPAEFGKVWARIYEDYESSLSVDQQAAELGLTRAVFKSRIDAYIVGAGLSDVGLAPFAKGEAVRRSLFEEMMPVLAGITYNQSEKVKP